LNGATSTSAAHLLDRETKKKQRTCNDFNRQFCLGYNLPICKGAEEKDVFATCFQRDSAKDEAVVFIFIFATVGLLGWAAVRPWVERWMQVSHEWYLTDGLLLTGQVENEGKAELYTRIKSRRAMKIWSETPRK